MQKDYELVIVSISSSFLLLRLFSSWVCRFFSWQPSTILWPFGYTFAMLVHVILSWFFRLRQYYVVPFTLIHNIITLSTIAVTFRIFFITKIIANSFITIEHIIILSPIVGITTYFVWRFMPLIRDENYSTFCKALKFSPV